MCKFEIGINEKVYILGELDEYGFKLLKVFNKSDVAVEYVETELDAYFDYEDDGGWHFIGKEGKEYLITFRFITKKKGGK